MARAAFLEADAEFEGVGAHPLNPRYDPVDEDGYYEQLEPAPYNHPALYAARMELALGEAPEFQGHDGSHYQVEQGLRAGQIPPVNLVELAQASQIVWWKATQSVRYVDPTFAGIWLEAEALFRYRMAYHWLSSTTDPVAQAEHLIEILDALGGLGPGDGVMIDAEEAGVTEGKCVAFAETIEGHYRRPCVSTYSGLYVAGGSIWNSDEIREGNYGHRPMHLAAYVTKARLQFLMRQRNAKPYDAWQYSSNGPVPGVVGRADMNTEVSWPAYDLICSLQLPDQPEHPLPEPEPEPEPEPTPTPPSHPGGDMSALITPIRVYDSRNSHQHQPGETFYVRLPEKPADRAAAIVNITVVEPAASGFLVAWGDGPQPATSNLNMHGDTDANLAVVPVGVEGGINIFTSGATHVLIDLQGWA